MYKNIFNISICFVIIVFSCKTKSNDVLVIEKETMIDTLPGSCSFLTKDDQNRVVLSWIRQKDSASNIFCYSISPDGGKTFGKPVEIPGSDDIKPNGENLPKIIFKPSGEIIAVWGVGNPNPKNKYSGLVYYARSFNEGITWNRATLLVKDTASFDQRYFDVAMLPNGEAGIVWLDNRKTMNREGSGLYYATTKGNRGFQNEKLISEPCCQCCRTDLFIDSKNNIHTIYRAIINDSIRDMVHIISTDGGNTFTKPVRISNDNWVINGCPHTGPAMAENKQGIHFAWFTAGGGSGIYYNHSNDHGHSFSPRDTVSGQTAKHSQIISLDDGNILITWNEAFVNGKTVNSRIGIEKRNAEGHRLAKQYITEENSQSSYPVLQSINESQVILAYTENIEGKDFIYYKLIKLN
jgi:hypothetical protein